MELVLDCSMALAWAIPDEGSRAADRLLGRLSRGSRLWIPALWWYELANALVAACRRGRMSEADASRLTELYGGLPLFTDTLLGSAAVSRFRALAERHGLSAYDAAYLDLAQRRGIALATLDKGLAAAGRQAGVRVVQS